MADIAQLPLPDDPRLAQNIVHFVRALRRAGLPVGPGRAIEAVRAVAAVGVRRRADVYHALQASLVTRPEDRLIFAQIFRLYWRDPRYLEHMMSLLLPTMRGVQQERAAQPAEKRAAEALLDPAAPEVDNPTAPDGTEITIDSQMTLSAQERLRTLDFEQMSTAEIAQAKRMIAALRLPVPPLRTRRQSAAAQGRLDARATLRAALRHQGEIRSLHHSRPGQRWPALVALCDISGSMSAYARMVLHFLHAVRNTQGAGWAEVHAFTFGTRLTNITRHLSARDVDAALAAAGQEAQDWEGGTRIGACLHSFNREWSRRVMGQGAVVLLITDGLDRGDPEALGRAMQRLHLSARRVIWLNPLMRFDGFAPKAGGIRAMLPHVDSFRAGHSIAALEDLAQALSRPEDSGDKARLMRML